MRCIVFRIRLRKRAVVLCLLTFVFLLLYRIVAQSHVSVSVWQPFSGPVCRADTGGLRRLAVTFETLGDGDTHRLLCILESYDAHATFFLEGRWAELHPEEVREIAEAGHEIGNHSQTHPGKLHSLQPENMNTELSLCSQRIRELTGLSPTVFRPPYGIWNETLVGQAHALGMETVLWDVDSLDWKNTAPEEAARRVAEEAGPGSILRFQNSALNTPDTLERVLEKLSREGYEFVTVSQLLNTGQENRNAD